MFAQKSKEMTNFEKSTLKPLPVSSFAKPCESQVPTAKGLSGAEGFELMQKIREIVYYLKRVP